MAVPVGISSSRTVCWARQCPSSVGRRCCLEGLRCSGFAAANIKCNVLRILLWEVPLLVMELWWPSCFWWDSTGCGVPAEARNSLILSSSLYGVLSTRLPSTAGAVHGCAMIWNTQLWALSGHALGCWACGWAARETDSQSATSSRELWFYWQDTECLLTRRSFTWAPWYTPCSDTRWWLLGWRESLRFLLFSATESLSAWMALIRIAFNICRHSWVCWLH